MESQTQTQPTKPAAVQLFVTCIIETLRPQAGISVVKVLEKCGIEVLFPQGQTCCGQPAYNAGAWKDAREMAKYTLDVLSCSPMPIVVPSGSCADMIVHQYPALFANDPVYAAKAQDVAARTYEFAQFLVDVLGLEWVLQHITPAATEQGKIAYHPSCHLLRGLNVSHQPQTLLKTVAHAEMVDIPNATECCGFGGLFAIKMSDISGAMLNRKLDHITASGAKTLVGCDASCLLHIGGGLHRHGCDIQVKHIAEVLI
jgi:L-lactate dehydrogenase complex protein LldE